MRSISLALESLRTNPLRTALTVLGLTMGSAALIGVMTIIQGANGFVADKIANLGSDVFRVAKQSFDITNLEEYYLSQRNPDITRQDVAAVRAACSSCLAVGVSITDRAVVRLADTEIRDVTFEGASPEMASIGNRDLATGRWFTASEDKYAAEVCMLGSELSDELFGVLDPLGREVRVDQRPLRVIGVFAPIGSVLGQNQDRFLVTPLSRFRQIRGLRRSLTLEVQAGEGPGFERAQDEVRAVLRGRRGIGPRDKENFYLATSDGYIALWQQISSSFTAVFIAVSAVAALVGGIVIMNILLVSVSERTREIGVRRAVGARRSDILRQFLTESLLQCVAGGLLGSSVGLAAALALREIGAFPAEVRWWTAAIGVGYAAAIGLFFGIYPAMRAADLDPIEALKEVR